MLKGNKILLRSLTYSDLNFLKSIENNIDNWHFGSEEKKFSNDELTNYIENAKIDIKIAKQYRFVIDYKCSPVGFIDLYNYKNKSVEIGIIISEKYRNRGFAKESLFLILDYSLKNLGLKKISATISSENLLSLMLFNSCGFKIHKTENNLIHFYKLAM